jgi:hypothetical protein
VHPAVFKLKQNKLYLVEIEFKVLRRIFGTERDEVTGGWRKLHNEELHNVYYLRALLG